MSRGKKKWVSMLTSSVALCALVMGSLFAQTQKPSVGEDCSRYIGPRKTVNGQLVGPKTCNIVEQKKLRNAYGVAFRRVDMGISGSIPGYTVMNNLQYNEYFTNVPEFTLAQRGNMGPYFHGIGTYEADKGSGMTILLPESASDWNGKLFVIVHGSAMYPRLGNLMPRKPNQYNPLMGGNAYAGLMIDKGYAVAYTRRSATKFGSRSGAEQVTLDDGTVLTDKSYPYHTGLIIDFTQLATAFVESQLGRKTERTYYYGHSAGASIGHLINYVPGANLYENGDKVFDGILADDAGGGWYMPTLHFVRGPEKEGVFTLSVDQKDHLVFDDAHRKAFAEQIDIAHQIYAGNDYVTGPYISLKRRNARILLEKGLGPRIRTYEIQGVSHLDAGRLWRSELSSQNIDLSGVFDVLIDVLDHWVDDGIDPGPTRSDAYNLGDADRDGHLENPAVALPEIACPTGVYYEFPEGIKSPGRTGLVPYLKEARPALNADTETLPRDFSQEWLEPLDSRGYLVDMNKNHVRDTRESVTQAWRRRAEEGRKYGVLGPYEDLTHARYVSCVTQVVSELMGQNLLSESAVLEYISKAVDSDIGKPAVSGRH